VRPDGDLISACLDGDEAAWSELVDRYGRLVYSIPRRYGFAETDADDVFQSVFTIVFRKLADLRDERRLSSWIITTTHRECWRIGRRRDAAPDLLETIADVGSPEKDDADRWERQHLVRSALTELGGSCEHLLTALFYAPGPPDYASIAERLGMKIGSIGPTRARCFAKLERILVRMGLGEGEEEGEGEG
jgi:RNA polymerase sigma factor (sigma-70 family)